MTSTRDNKDAEIDYPALHFLMEKGKRNAAASRHALQHLLEESGLSWLDYQEVLERIRSNTQIAIHFHPERLTKAGHSVAEGLVRMGRFCTQYETGISSGSPTAFPGGARDEWEKIFFGGQYHQETNKLLERPKYGALMLGGHLDGPAPRFGSCYLVLDQKVNTRSSYTYGGNQGDLMHEKTGTWENLDRVILALLVAREQDHILGLKEKSLGELLHRIGVKEEYQRENRSLGNALDSFVEAQIHGPVDLEKDAVKLVADSSFRETEIHTAFKELSNRFKLEIDWYPGYALPIAEVPSHFRGYEIGPLVKRIATDGILTTAKIGEAANAFQRGPESWPYLGEGQEPLTYFRRVWHALLYHGRRADSI